MTKRLLSLSLCLAFGSALATPTAIIHTTKGDITVELDEDKAPASVANFRRYAEDGFYNDRNNTTHSFNKKNTTPNAASN